MRFILCYWHTQRKIYEKVYRSRVIITIIFSYCILLVFLIAFVIGIIYVFTEELHDSTAL